jgi:hypothetical protein
MMFDTVSPDAPDEDYIYEDTEPDTLSVNGNEYDIDTTELVTLYTHYCTRCTFRTQDEDKMHDHIWTSTDCASTSYTRDDGFGVVRSEN